MVAGSGGAGGQSGAADKPSTDCSTHTETNHCFSFKGMLDGRPFDKTCLMDTGGLRQDVTINHAWTVSCEDTAISHADAVVSIKQQMPGAFHYTAAEQDGFGVDIDVFDGMSDAMSGMPSIGDALIEGEVQMVGTHPLLVGTFHATWIASMDSGCPSGGCPAATITGSFRSEFDF
jgi:hypothetical protein